MRIGAFPWVSVAWRAACCPGWRSRGLRRPGRSRRPRPPPGSPVPGPWVPWVPGCPGFLVSWMRRAGSGGVAAGTAATWHCAGYGDMPGQPECAACRTRGACVSRPARFAAVRVFPAGCRPRPRRSGTVAMGQRDGQDRRNVASRRLRAWLWGWLEWRAGLPGASIAAGDGCMRSAPGRGCSSVAHSEGNAPMRN
jgi:hypothetical protein